MGKYYTFRRRHPAPYAGHNHLAGLAYSVVSVGLFAQILHGPAAVRLDHAVRPHPRPVRLGHSVPGGIQTVRMLHYIITFLFFAFAIHHVYSAILVDIEERTGVMSSIFSGYKNIRPSSSLEALGLVGNSPEERARSEFWEAKSAKAAEDSQGRRQGCMRRACWPPPSPRRWRPVSPTARWVPARPGPAARSPSRSASTTRCTWRPNPRCLHAELALRARGLEGVEVRVTADPVTCVMCDAANEVRADHPFCAECGWPLPDRGGHAVTAVAVWADEVPA